MPYMHIRITDEGVSSKQKQQLIEGSTQLLVEVLNKKPEYTHVVIEEVPTENWGVSGQQYSTILQQ